MYGQLVGLPVRHHPSRLEQQNTIPEYIIQNHLILDDFHSNLFRVEDIERKSVVNGKSVKDSLLIYIRWLVDTTSNGNGSLFGDVAGLPWSKLMNRNNEFGKFGGADNIGIASNVDPELIKNGHSAEAV